ncbi:hypothetical protein ACFYO2_08910 [Streptomyces sp. NPDC006602]|uniref:hypothetical protein n=1 Tax=Streptomyces sp. NPDC006602 TaxID=3364751 RepID=UPI0036A97AB2
MSADASHGEGPELSTGVRTGPRHAAPKKPLFTRFHMPAGKAIAMAAMPTAVLMGIGFTPTLALADEQPTSKSLTADEYKDCLAALDEDGASASPTPSPSASSSDEASTDEDKGESAEPSPSASASSGSGDSSSSDSGSDDKADPTPSASASPSKESNSASGDTATASPSPSDSGGNLLEDIGDAITGIFTGGDKAAESASPTPTASPSASESTDTTAGTDSAAKDTSDAVKETTEKVTGAADDTVKDTTDTASKAAEDTTKAVEDAAEAAADATATPSPSASSTTDPEDCPVATEAEGDVDNKIAVADNPWYLEASSLTLKGADYQGVVEVKTASGKTKKVLKYVISGGTDIGDLHQLVKEHGKTYHVQAAKGSTSTITDGDTVMYTESISGNLLGLIPITFDPEHPPPLNIPLIYFTNVKITQAAQFGGTLHVPGMQQYTTD